MLERDTSSIVDDKTEALRLWLQYVRSDPSVSELLPLSCCCWTHWEQHRANVKREIPGEFEHTILEA